MTAAFRVSSVYDENCCKHLVCCATCSWEPMLLPRKRCFATLAENSMLFWDPSSAETVTFSPLPRLFVRPTENSNDPALRHALSSAADSAWHDAHVQASLELH